MSGIDPNDFSKQLSDLSKKLKHTMAGMGDFLVLLHSGKFSDIKLVVGDKEFRVHKNILSFHSRVFSAMFENNMQEKNNNLVVITDINHEVMKEVLYFMYVGLSVINEKLVPDLLYAADKYEIDGLKFLCEDKLIQKISIENVGEMLITVDRFNTEELKEHLFEFIRDNSEDVVESEAFNSALKLLSANLLADCLKYVMKRK